jgi:hypothetical protein
MFSPSDVTGGGTESLADALQEAVALLEDNDTLSAKHWLLAFLETEPGSFVEGWEDMGGEDDGDDEPITATPAEHTLACEIAGEAIDLIDNGLLSDAMHRLNLFCAPKWQSVTGCQSQYDDLLAEQQPVLVPTPAPSYVQISFQI